MNKRSSIPVFKPSLKRKDFDAVLSCLVSDNMSSGSIVDQFVREVSGYLGLNGGVALRDFARALEIAFEALELTRGDSIVLSPLAPAVYLHVIERAGFVPLLADVDLASGCITAESVEPLLTSKPAAMIVHYPMGIIPDIESLVALDIPIIEDITTAFGGNTGESKCGKAGRYAILGLEADGIITVGGGALILSDSRSDVSTLRELVGRLGPSASMQDMNGALGLVQMKSVERFIQMRKEIAGYYERSLLKTRHKTLTQNGEGENVYYTFPVVLTGGMREVQQYARKKRVTTSAAFDQSIVATDGVGDRCPNAKKLYLRCLMFPLYPSLRKQDAEHVAKVIASLP